MTKHDINIPHYLENLHQKLVDDLEILNSMVDITPKIVNEYKSKWLGKSGLIKNAMKLIRSSDIPPDHGFNCLF